MDEKALKRFSAKYQPRLIVPELGACWIWNAYINPYGYGQFSYQGKATRAYLVSYLHYVGPVPIGLHLDHVCNVKACVNWEHLEPVTQAENNRRKVPKTHCINGHEYSEENTTLNYKGVKVCKACWKKHQAEYFQRTYVPKAQRVTDER